MKYEVYYMSNRGEITSKYDTREEAEQAIIGIKAHNTMMHNMTNHPDYKIREVKNRRARSNKARTTRLTWLFLPMLSDTSGSSRCPCFHENF